MYTLEIVVSSASVCFMTSGARPRTTGLDSEISVIKDSRMTMCGFRFLSSSIHRVAWTIEIQLG
jgi:hypothetical protein